MNQLALTSRRMSREGGLIRTSNDNTFNTVWSRVDPSVKFALNGVVVGKAAGEVSGLRKATRS